MSKVPCIIHKTTLITVVLSLLLSATLLDAAPRKPQAKTIPSHYIVVFKEGVDTDEAASKFLKRFSALQVNMRYRHALRGMAVKMPEQLVAKVAADASVAYVEPDVFVSLNAQTLPTGVNRIDADLDAAANIDGVDDRVDVDIAVIDTGIDIDHPDLNVYRYAYCQNQGPVKVVCPEGDAGADDDNGHGTHVAGIAAALDNTTGVVGVAPGARLWGIKVLDKDGNGVGSHILAGVDYVASHSDEIDVANMSLTGEGEFQSLDDAIAGAVSAGVVFTLAAGNDHIDVSQAFPAGHPDAITVSALSDYDGIAGGLSGNANDDTFASFSNYGSGVDIMAPGMSIRSTYFGGGLKTLSGTSMASPHVAGAAALYIEQNPGVLPTAVKLALIAAGDFSPCASPDGICGDPDIDGIQEPLLMFACEDVDEDGVCDDVDNCPLNPNPLQIDTDFDLAGDACDDDDDNDGLSDADEATYGTDPLLQDSDGDTLNDGDEVNIHGTDPALADTDSDGFSDDEEIAAGSDPADADSWPNFADGDLSPVGAPDGTINASDYLVMLRIVLGEIDATSLELAHGDLYPVGTPDGIIDVSDLILLLDIVQ